MRARAGRAAAKLLAGNGAERGIISLSRRFLSPRGGGDRPVASRSYVGNFVSRLNRLRNASLRRWSRSAYFSPLPASPLLFASASTVLPRANIPFRYLAVFLARSPVRPRRNTAREENSSRLPQVSFPLGKHSTRISELQDTSVVTRFRYSPSLARRPSRATPYISHRAISRR